jgi:uncharacterized SAM-binding protein YcdF (DUF218 family)
LSSATLFFVDKLLTPFLEPLGLVLVLTAVAVVWAALARRKLLALFLCLLVLVLYVPSTPAVSLALAGVLESRYPPVPVAKAPSADVIVVLGGATGPAFPPRQLPDLNEHADRLWLAALLYEAGKAKHVIASGGDWRDTGRPEAPDMAEVMEDFGVPPAAIVRESRSVDTAQNARFSAELMRQNGWRTALLVTSGIHMPRAVLTFRRAGVTVVPMETDLIDAPSPTPSVIDWLPDVQALSHTTDAVRELLGIVYYRLRGEA